MGRGRKSYNRKCKVTRDELTNRNDVVESVGDGPTETTAGTTNDKEAWESLWSDYWKSFPSMYHVLTITMAALKWVAEFELK